MSAGRTALAGHYKRGQVVVAALTGETCRLVRPLPEGFWLSVVLQGHPATVGSFQYIKPAQVAND